MNLKNVMTTTVTSDHFGDHLVDVSTTLFRDLKKILSKTQFNLIDIFTLKETDPNWEVDTEELKDDEIYKNYVDGWFQNIDWLTKKSWEELTNLITDEDYAFNKHGIYPWMPKKDILDILKAM